MKFKYFRDDGFQASLDFTLYSNNTKATVFLIFVFIEKFGFDEFKSAKAIYKYTKKLKYAKKNVFRKYKCLELISTPFS